MANICECWRVFSEVDHFASISIATIFEMQYDAELSIFKWIIYCKSRNIAGAQMLN